MDVILQRNIYKHRIPKQISQPSFVPKTTTPPRTSKGGRYEKVYSDNARLGNEFENNMNAKYCTTHKEFLLEVSEI